MNRAKLIEKLSAIENELKTSNSHDDAADIKSLISIISSKSENIKDIKLIDRIKDHCLSHRGYLDISGGEMSIDTWANILNEVGRELKNISNEQYIKE